MNSTFYEFFNFDYCYFMITVFRNNNAILDSVRTD
jgi:hypothetical protein